eukprot:CAMPEP_0181235584 /NCGR_PEP_ID=MMETSP1096-20121128/37661_1 /TAXON_ID=156174 ORGANISM="Chrysochromulina ericina, Strain CCMP281" /NCGR_SAMPLE_ID=MMETSP1096 /ASSEMBLY_ACC=CAM_ASM_000453 /LENGTH=120 /DNA_ID=CAMNT_0023330589 /DNA_START=422 /DNA_END=784 /DNA_ORIENTATION=+
MLVCVRLSNYATSHRVFQRHAGIAPVTDSALMQADRAIKPVQHQVPAELMHEQRVWVERMHLHTLGRPEPREDRVVAVTLPQCQERHTASFPECCACMPRLPSPPQRNVAKTAPLLAPTN